MALHTVEQTTRARPSTASLNAHAAHIQARKIAVPSTKNTHCKSSRRVMLASLEKKVRRNTVRRLQVSKVFVYRTFLNLSKCDRVLVGRTRRQKKINKNGTLIQTDMRAHTTQKPKPHCLTDSGMAAFSFAVEPICDVNSALKEHRIRRRCMSSGGTLDGRIDDR